MTNESNERAEPPRRLFFDPRGIDWNDDADIEAWARAAWKHAMRTWDEPTDTYRATHLDPWEDRNVQCGQCGWAGLARDASTEYFTEIVVVRCPTCDWKFFTVVAPTRDETESAAARGDTAAIHHLQLLDYLDQAHAAIAEIRKGRDHLPEISGGALEFAFLAEGGSDELNPNWLVLTCNGAEIYREPTGFEGWSAIIEIGQKVLTQYTGRVAWIDPGRAGDCLGGDQISWASEIHQFLTDNHIAPPTGTWAARS